MAPPRKMFKRKDGADSDDDSDFSDHYDGDWNTDDERAVPFTSEGVRGTYALFAQKNHLPCRQILVMMSTQRLEGSKCGRNDSLP